MTKKNYKSNVTVAVITYNSAATVLETLDSIITQSYGPGNIELIISDDGSKDNTVQVVESWLVEHQCRFYNVIFFDNPTNLGISKNCNIAWNAATSDWIKTIAGDDILQPNCIADNVSFVQASQYKDIVVLFSKMQSFRVNEFGCKQNLAILPTRHAQNFFILTPQEQFKYLQRKGISGAPTAFINRHILASIGFADERFPMMEDHPLWFKISQAGYKLYFMEKTTVYYRISDSVSNSKTRLINEKYLNQIIAVEEQLVIPTLGTDEKILKLRKEIWPKLALKVAKFFDNRVTIVSKLVLAAVFIIRPGFLLSQVYKVFKI